MTPSVHGAQPVESGTNQTTDIPPALPTHDTLQNTETPLPPTQGEGAYEVTRPAAPVLAVDSVRHPELASGETAGISFFQTRDATGRLLPPEAVAAGEAAIPNRNDLNEKQRNSIIPPLITAPTPVLPATQQVVESAASVEPPDLLQLEAPPITEPAVFAPEAVALADPPDDATEQKLDKKKEEAPVNRVRYAAPEVAGEAPDWHKEPIAPTTEAGTPLEQEPKIQPPVATPQELKKTKPEIKKEKVLAAAPPKPALKAAKPRRLHGSAILSIAPWKLEPEVGRNHFGTLV